MEGPPHKISVQTIPFKLQITSSPDNIVFFPQKLEKYTLITPSGLDELCEEGFIFIVAWILFRDKESIAVSGCVFRVDQRHLKIYNFSFHFSINLTILKFAIFRNKNI